MWILHDCVYGNHTLPVDEVLLRDKSTKSGDILFYSYYSLLYLFLPLIILSSSLG